MSETWPCALELVRDLQSRLTQSRLAPIAAPRRPRLLLWMTSDEMPRMSGHFFAALASAATDPLDALASAGFAVKLARVNVDVERVRSVGVQTEGGGGGLPPAVWRLFSRMYQDALRESIERDLAAGVHETLAEYDFNFQVAESIAAPLQGAHRAWQWFKWGNS